MHLNSSGKLITRYRPSKWSQTPFKFLIYRLFQRHNRVARPKKIKETKVYFNIFVRNLERDRLGLAASKQIINSIKNSSYQNPNRNE